MSGKYEVLENISEQLERIELLLNVFVRLYYRLETDGGSVGEDENFNSLLASLRQSEESEEERMCMLEISPEEAQVIYEDESNRLWMEWEAEHYEPDSLVSVYGMGWVL